MGLIVLLILFQMFRAEKVSWCLGYFQKKVYNCEHAGTNWLTNDFGMTNDK